MNCPLLRELPDYTTIIRGYLCFKIYGKVWRGVVIEKAVGWTLKYSMLNCMTPIRGGIPKRELRRLKWVLAQIIEKSGEIGDDDGPKGDLVGRW
jgi:hypothetical protein